MDKYIGKRLDGRYEIQELIGVGGMANVYRAVDILEQKIVAVKILRDEFLSNEEFVRRFKNESKTIAILSHPNIVKVYDVSFSDKYQFIVMEYVNGITLKEYITQKGTIHWKEVVHFSTEVLEALRHAHSKGVIHRDIKPQNIMLLENGQIKVMDFGIARFARSETRSTSDKAIGSVHYISPEQARGEHTGPPTDLYSVGVMMFEMLTGQLPFEADSAVSVAIKQISASPQRPREINPEIPEGLEDIVIRAMQKDPAKRYQSADEMLRDIEIFKRNPSIQFEYKYMPSGNANYMKKIEAKTDTQSRIDVDAIEDKPYIIGEREEDMAQRKSSQNNGRKPATKTKQSTKTKKSRQVDEYDDDYYYDDEEESKSTLVPALIAVGVAFALVAIVIVVIFITMNNPFGSGNTVEVPDLVGLRYEDIKDDEKYKTYTIQDEAYEYTDNFPEGMIYSQDPSAGTNAKDTIIIRVKISRGVQNQTVPDLTGKTKADAKAALESLGLVPRFQDAYDETVAKGNVIKTDPASGSSYQTGSSISVFISMGPQPKTVSAPNVIGQESQDNAKTMLEAVGLKLGTVTTVTNEQPAGTVVTQDPAAGTEVDSDTAVNIEVSDGNGKASVSFRQNVSMPNTTQSYTCTVTVDDTTVYTQTIIPANGGIVVDCNVSVGSTISVYLNGALLKTYLVVEDGSGNIVSTMMIDNSYDFGD